jgi:hypothetical protein
MESKKLNVTEEWFQVITQLTLSYQRQLSASVRIDDQVRESVKVNEIVMAPVIRLDIKRENQKL